jgi:L-2,4-diaminobutyric acid acetyltransferase
MRKPIMTDGLRVNRLIASCKPLDTNSVYCNLLQCTHFAETCAIAEDPDQEVIGFASAYFPPGKPDTLFVWQIAVSQSARGQGLGKRLLKEILSRPACRKVAYLETTVTESNRASRALFQSLANEYGGDLHSSTLFDKNGHFAGGHESEILLRIGPIRHPAN